MVVVVVGGVGGVILAVAFRLKIRKGQPPHVHTTCYDVHTIYPSCMSDGKQMHSLILLLCDLWLCWASIRRVPEQQNYF